MVSITLPPMAMMLYLDFSQPLAKIGPKSFPARLLAHQGK